MKKLIIASIASTILLSSSAFSSDLCVQVQQISAQVMEMRQAGVRLSEMMKTFEGDKSMQDTILLAYETPKMRAKSNQQFEIDRFSNLYTRMCYKMQKRNK